MSADYKGGHVREAPEPGERHVITERWQVEHSLHIIALTLVATRKILEHLSAHICAGGTSENNAILQRIAEMERKVISAISDYTTLVDEKFTELGATVDTIVSGLTGVTADVATLKALIEKLQSNPGPITPKDQALLDQSIVKITGIFDRLKGVSTELAALDAATAPAEVPVPEPV